MTPDKDLGQCLENDHVVQVDVIRKRVTNEEALRQRRGVGPGSIPDFLALTGDDADGIPGLPGFGERTAAALLGRFVHLEGIPLDGHGWPVDVRSADRLAATLRARLGARHKAAVHINNVFRFHSLWVDSIPRERCAELAASVGQTSPIRPWCRMSSTRILRR